MAQLSVSFHVGGLGGRGRCPRLRRVGFFPPDLHSTGRSRRLITGGFWDHYDGKLYVPVIDLIVLIV